MKIKIFKPKLIERRVFKRHANALFASILGETDAFRADINSWENNYLALSILVRTLFHGGLVALVAIGIGVALERGGYVTLQIAAVIMTAGSIAGFVIAGIAAINGKQQQDRMYQRTALAFINFAKCENLYIFPFTKRSRSRRDGMSNRSGAMVTAVEARIQAEPQLIHRRAVKLYTGAESDEGLTHEKLGLPRTAASALESLDPEGPAVLIRGLFERQRLINYAARGFEVERIPYRRERYFLRSRRVRNAIKAGLVIRSLGSIMRDERRNEPGWRRSYITAPNEQVTVLKENEDMRLRFRTASPHLSWPDANNQTVGNFETAQHVVIQCVQNPMNLPVHLISVRDVIAQIPDALEANKREEGVDLKGLTEETVLARLLGAAPVMFSRWNTAAMRHRDQIPTNQPILRDLNEDPDNPDYVLRWDPNRINWESLDESDQELRFSFGVLLRAVELAGRSSCRCVLRRGDALVVDNLRCLMARREFSAGSTGQRIKYGLGIDPHWELRAYSGFRPVRLA